MNNLSPPKPTPAARASIMIDPLSTIAPTTIVEMLGSVKSWLDSFQVTSEA